MLKRSWHTQQTIRDHLQTLGNLKPQSHQRNDDTKLMIIIITIIFLLLITASGNVDRFFNSLSIASGSGKLTSGNVTWLQQSSDLEKKFSRIFQWILWWIFLWLISLAEAVVRHLLNLSKIHQIINAIGRMNFLKRLPSWYLAWFEIL